jgi:hypothetical protein
VAVSGAHVDVVHAVLHHDVAAQLEFESKIEAEIESSLSHFSFKRLVPGAFNVGLIVSICAVQP